MALILSGIVYIHNIFHFAYWEECAFAINFVTLACFSVILIYPDSLFNYFTIVILSVMTAVTFPLCPPHLAFAICG